MYDPTKRYATSSDIDSFIVDDNWSCELVNPKHPALHKPATLDPFSGTVDWTEREKDMIALMHENFGIGLAAPQTGSSYNMFVMTHSFLGDMGVYKPEILETQGTVKMEEGCLTFPLLYFSVERPERIKVRFTKTDGEKIVEMWMDGMDARCFLHEYEHLQGKLYLDHASDLKLKRAKARRDKLLKQGARRMA